MGRFDAGSILVMLDRGDYWQCAYVIAKGSAERLKAEGMPSASAPHCGARAVPGDRLDELRELGRPQAAHRAVSTGWTQWYRPGLLCIGDAAHAMSPIGGVGINLAIQDAVAAANILAVPLREGRLRDADLQAVQARRMWPVRATQGIQVFMQNRMIAPTLRRHAAAAAALAGAAARSLRRAAAPAGAGAGARRAARARAEPRRMTRATLRQIKAALYDRPIMAP